MKRAILVPSIALLVSLLALGPGQAQQIDRPKRGLILAKQICAQCHSVEKGSPRSPKPPAPRFESIANIPGMTARAIIVALHTSHPTMPNMMLERDEIDDIVAYILSLKRTNR
jgi:cytochrome c